MSDGPVRLTETRTRSGHEAQGLLQAAYGREFRARSLPRDREHHMRRFDADAFEYSEMALPAHFEFAKEPQGTLVVVSIESGQARRRMGRQEGNYAAGDVYVGHVPMQECSGTAADVLASAVTLPAGLLAQAAATVDARRVRPLRFTGLVPADPQHAAHWERMRAYAGSVCELGADAGPLLIGPAARLLAGAVLQVFPNTVVGQEPTLPDTRDATPSTTARATVYIDEHAHTDIGLSDIAAAAQVTPRALQSAFRQHLDTTPMTYLRRVRLGHAHAALKDADPLTGVTVTQIAAQWGFLHPSRFSAAYRAEYGCTPRTTLHS
ncbi:helix-turn-helix transcriptional regulator [Streptomyces longispororuber]|uniref:helix-turn-helix transcriptional regulator n=1 Tax=Streptomyces longispororuber TaxID=68230 RepID=UPI00210A5B4D|nr:helix-turn-helix transcriptional regulator [Streptomyces longispororuber]MCQ4208953.1 helix-turn-helix transcriptional regulator [Streptomyces longispororuber]